MAAKKTRYVTADDGTRYPLIVRKPIGLVACTGDAHANPHIDHCGHCAPRWGEAVVYEPIALAACADGFAVPLSDVPLLDEGDEWEVAEQSGRIRRVHVTERRPSLVSSFYAWVRT